MPQVVSGGERVLGAGLLQEGVEVLVGGGGGGCGRGSRWIVCIALEDRGCSQRNIDCLSGRWVTHPAVSSAPILCMYSEPRRYCCNSKFVDPLGLLLVS